MVKVNEVVKVDERAGRATVWVEGGRGAEGRRHDEATGA